MPDFNTLRDQLRQARQQADAAETKSLASRQQLRQLQEQLANLLRRLDPTQPGQVADRDRLQKQCDDQQAQVKPDLDDWNAARAALNQLETDFLPFTDPTELLAQLEDDWPLLLFPVRLETRFKTVTVDGATHDQLWVRVYPDVCLIDTFEETLTEAEIRNARNYWQERWRTGSAAASASDVVKARVEAGRRAAWRGLVASHGSGRSEWIVRNYSPVNATEQPARAALTDVILVIPTETPLPDAERTAAVAFWKAIWLADRDLKMENDARAALEAAVSPARAQVIATEYRPVNLAESPSGQPRAAVQLTVAFVVFAATPAKLRGWNRPPRVDLLPERFLLLAYQGSTEVLHVPGNPIHTPLVVGMDPSIQSGMFAPDADGNLKVPEAMLWMVDFDRAVEWGMGFRIDLTPEQAGTGFDRLFVIGVRMQATSDDGQQLVERLLQHHQFGQSGFAILPQGTPTNNTEGQGSGLSRLDDADASFDRLFKNGPDVHSAPSPFDKTDLYWLAELLGIDGQLFTTVAQGRGSDQREAKALNRALWPATMGYFLHTLMYPLFASDTVDQVEWFFTHFVSGRGYLPAIRIGAEPYGILPATAFGRIGWFGKPSLDEKRQNFLGRLYRVLMQANTFWAERSQDVVAVGRPGSDPQQTLLTILGLQATSAEYYARFLETFDHLLNIVAYTGGAHDFYNKAQPFVDQAHQFLKDKFPGTTLPQPDLAALFCLKQQGRLHGPLIDDGPLSETEPVRDFEGFGVNYLVRVSHHAENSLDQLRTQQEYHDPPRALLYLLLRQAVFLGYHDAAYRLYKSVRDMDPKVLEKLRREPPFIHIPRPVDPPILSNSRWEPLYSAPPDKTGTPATSGPLVWQILRNQLQGSAASGPIVGHLRQQLDRLKQLSGIPSAALERLLAEHIDICSYRHDAWLLGLAHLQLALMRYQKADDQLASPKQGVYVGAYAWLENVRRKDRVLKAVELESDLQPIFADGPPLMRDSLNGGYVHAPSLNHAVTAAVLRNGYLSNASPTNSDLLAVNLSSNRVRLALSFLEGMRAGQSLAALLGYQLERGLHDAYGLAECDSLIYDLRRAFPLRAGNLQSTKITDSEVQTVQADGTKAIECLEARNVVDGLKLLEQVRSSKRPSYPFGLAATVLPPRAAAGTLSTRTDDQTGVVTVPQPNTITTGDRVDLSWDTGQRLGMTVGAVSGNQVPIGSGGGDPLPAVGTAVQICNDPAVLALNKEVDRLRDIHDALADLALAEGVHQATQGNFDRVSATLDTMITGNYPPLPTVVQTPMTGLVLTHRVALQLDAAATAQESDPPRVQATPALNQWLQGVLPSLGKIGCFVCYPAPAAPQPVLMSQLGIQPLDWLFLVPLDVKADLTELDDRVLREVFKDGEAYPGAAWQIDYRSAPEHTLSVFEVAALTRALRSVVEKSRPLHAADAARPGEATQAQAQTGSLDPPTAVVQALGQLQTDLQAFRTALPTDSVAVVNGIDDAIAGAVELLVRAAGFGIPGGWGALYRGKRDLHARIRSLAADRVKRWDTRLEQFQKSMTEYAALPTDAPDAARWRLLTQADHLVSNAPLVPPATMAAFETLVADHHTAFAQKRQDLQAVATSGAAAVTAVRAALAALLPLTAVDSEPIDLQPVDDQIGRLAQDLATLLGSLQKEVDQRLLAANAQVTAAAATADGPARLQSLTAATRALLGESFPVVPKYTVAPEQAAEWQNSWKSAQDGTLLKYLTDTLQVESPVDEWLYGVARVRPALATWERIVMHAGAFGSPEPELVPAQFPFQADPDPTEPGPHWLALDYPPKYKIEGEQLLYTACYAVAFDGTKPQCGLLLDEWTEVIPAKYVNPDLPQQHQDAFALTQETGLTFHYDRPNNEAPQALLLVTPATWDGKWKWEEVVAALHTTLDLAKQRAVEPGHLDGTPAAQFLPATVAAFTARDISIGTLLARNNPEVDL